MKLLYILLHQRAKDGLSPIYLRITVNKRAHFFTGHYVNPKEWDQASQICVGKGYASTNKYLYQLKSRAYEIYEEVELTGGYPSSSYIKDHLNPKRSDTPKISEVIQRYIDHKTDRGDWGEKYLSRNKRTLKLVQDFGDTYLINAKKHWIADWHAHISQKHNLSINMAAKYVEMLKTAITWAYDNELTPKNPFQSYKVPRKHIKKTYLTQSEVDAIYTKDLTGPISVVRDIFIFQIYTGMEYGRVRDLTMDMIDEGMNGDLWAFTDREKTDKPGNVPLLDRAIEMLDKYKADPCRTKGKAFPIKANQKMNNYLKDIGGICGITKNLTTHLARHTFSTTIWLRNGGDMVTLSKILGHKSIKTTQQSYADIIDERVADDFKKVSQKISEK